MKKSEIVLYNQNIWGGFSESHAIANRNGLLREIIFDYQADICCFQECHARSSRQGENAIQKLIGEVYAEVPTEAEEKNSTPVFYRKDRFNVIESGYHLFTGYNDVNSKSLTWCVLEDRENGVMLGVTSSHFWFKGPEEEHTLQRLENAKEMLAYVELIKEKYDIPVFSCGDFNCGEGHHDPAPIHFIKKHMVDVRDIAKETTYVHTCHDYPERNEMGLYDGEPFECTMTLDYVFLSDNKRVEVHSFKVDNGKRAYNSSDHCPLIIKATLAG